jgi:hypothetical protein
MPWRTTTGRESHGQQQTGQQCESTHTASLYSHEPDGDRGSWRKQAKIDLDRLGQDSPAKRCGDVTPGSPSFGPATVLEVFAPCAISFRPPCRGQVFFSAGRFYWFF